jgi:hypothetical protein
MGTEERAGIIGRTVARVLQFVKTTSGGAADLSPITTTTGRVR